MSEIDDGGPAFPYYNRSDAGTVSLRDYFAAKAMQGIKSNSDHTESTKTKYGALVVEAYEIADAMLAARKPKNNPADAIENDTMSDLGNSTDSKSKGDPTTGMRPTMITQEQADAQTLAAYQSGYEASRKYEDFEMLRDANVERNKQWDDKSVQGALFRACELGGESGEVLNVIKKLERERLGLRGSRDTVDHLAEELADVVICADLIGKDFDINLWDAIVKKFNATSDKYNLTVKL